LFWGIGHENDRQGRVLPYEIRSVGQMLFDWRERSFLRVPIGSKSSDRGLKIRYAVGRLPGQLLRRQKADKGRLMDVRGDQPHFPFQDALFRELVDRDVGVPDQAILMASHASAIVDDKEDVHPPLSLQLLELVAAVVGG